MGALKQEIQEMCFWLLHGTNVIYTTGKRVPPPEATVQLKKKIKSRYWLRTKGKD